MFSLIIILVFHDLTNASLEEKINPKSILNKGQSNIYLPGTPTRDSYLAFLEFHVPGFEQALGIFYTPSFEVQKIHALLRRSLQIKNMFQSHL